VLSCREWDRRPTVPFSLDASPDDDFRDKVVLDAAVIDPPARGRATLFLPPRERDSDGREGARNGFLLLGAGLGFVSLDPAAPAPAPAVLGFVVADVAAALLVRDAFVGEPTPKFHTLRTIDLAEERKPKRGVALPLSGATRRG